METIAHNNQGKNVSLNWQFVGKLKEVSVFNDNQSTFSWIKTETTAFAVKGFFKDLVHMGQAVKLSKKDNSVKVGNQLIERI